MLSDDADQSAARAAQQEKRLEAVKASLEARGYNAESLTAEALRKGGNELLRSAQRRKPEGALIGSPNLTEAARRL